MWKKLTAFVLALLLPAVAPVAVAATNGASAEPAKEGDSSLIWIILLCISLLGNVVQMIILTSEKKDRSDTQIDDVPLVEYDIDDDVI